MANNRTVAWGIFFLALALRLVYLLQVRHTPVLDFLYIDSDYYHSWAVSIAHGDILGGKQVFYSAPFYAYFLALIYFIFGIHTLPVLLIQILIGSLSCLLIFRIAEQYFDARTAVFAGVIAALYPVFIFYDAILLKANLMVFFLLLFVLLYTKGGMRNVFFAGVCIGINSLMRPTIFLILPLLVGYEFVKHRDELLKKAALLAAGIVITVFPVALRNRVVGGEWVMTVASGGMNFWTGNNSTANGAYVGAPFITSEEMQYEREDFVNEASRRAGKQLTIKESSAFWYREGLAFITANPERFLKLLYRKFVAYWHDIELPSDINYYMARDYATVLSSNPLTFGFIAPLAVLGIMLCRRWTQAHFILLAFAGTNLLQCLVFFNSSQYRFPAVPVYILFAAFFLSECVRHYKAHNTRALALALAAVPLLMFTNYRDHLLSQIAGTRVSYLNAASYYMRYHDYAKAEEMLRKCLEIDPDYALGHEKYALLLQATGRTEEARQYVDRAIQLTAATGDTRAIRSMSEIQQAGVLYSQKKYGEALALFQDILKQHPENAKELENNIGLCYVKLGDNLAAETYFLSALRRDPAYDKAYYNMGMLCMKKGDAVKAREYFSKAVAANPANAKAKQRLGQL